ncbi:T9SS type A sorting domain-containing protein [Marinoscillum furvescens]|uniref:Putative secreted protein (Por secretion system target) n=1 Tax=Marinoscillum furvescens DSM 4134 TaxID=1122208 RepID=A0A3D9L0V4_MARFU|nr:T9SS type A sorting domain-containing protein [Marinoscillum furvescens]RED95255.1 putative secreted protein (Por secretion system target) [Marinoscillum furvescens DSM 4134]
MQRIVNSLVLFVIYTVIGYTVSGQTAEVKIDASVQRYLGDVSELNRKTYFNIHSSGYNDPDVQQFLSDYDVYLGRGFWSPFGFAKNKMGETGKYPEHKQGDNSLRPVQVGHVATDHPKNVVRYSTDVEVAANWAVNYYENWVDQGGRPEFYEVMNEPFVHAGDEVFKAEQPDADKMRLRMAEWYGTIGKKIHESQALANMKVIGYSSAWPSLELWDFKHWNTRMKMFMDVAGEHMDGFATHLYDGINVTGQDTKRSGSNSEAILDLIEAYSYVKWGIVKPHAITEYGGIEKGYPAEYSDMKSIQSIRSMNRIIMGLMERENDMLISIPFIGDKAKWHLTAANNYNPYGSVLFIPTNLGEPNPEGWEYSARILFFELWKGVKGERLHIQSTNPDVQVQAFKDGDKIYVLLNSLSEETIETEMAWNNLGENFGADVRSLMIYPDKDPEYTTEHLNSLPVSVSLRAGETVNYIVTLKEDSEFSNSIITKKYYATNYLEPITINKPITFEYSDVETGTGYATLRMSIGRKHNVSKKPTVTVNGKTVAVPDNWKGYDQANREDFFGMIEIPVPMSYLSENATVKVTFPDNGGHLAAMILQVEKFTKDVEVESPVILDATSQGCLVYPNPMRDEVTLTWDAALNQNVSISIVALDGREVFSEQLRAFPGSARLLPGVMLPGVYQLQARCGEQYHTARLVVQ